MIKFCLQRAPKACVFECHKQCHSASPCHPQVLRLVNVLPRTLQMWLVVASIPLIPAVVMVSARYRVKLSTLCHRAVAWALRLVRRRVCVKSNYSFVFSQCTHGNAESVLKTFDLYAETHASLCIGPQIGQCTSK